MSVIRRVSPVLDGATVSLGSAAPRTIVIPAGEYATPLWVRDGGALVHRVGELPWRGRVVGDSLEVLSSAPGSPVQITTASLPDATEDAAYSATLQATGGDGSYAWSVTVGTLPAGLTLNGSTGEISGTPTTPGTSNFTVQADDGVITPATRALSLTVDAAGAVSPFYIFDPDDYADDAALWSDPNVTNGANSGGETTLQTAPSTTPLGSTKAVRSRYLTGQGNETQAGAGFDVPNAATRQLREIWVETELWWASNFDTDNGPGPGNPDQKVIFFFPAVPQGAKRVALNVGVFGSSIGHYIAGNGLNHGEDMSEFWAGSWRRVRMHLEYGDSPGSSTTTWTVQFVELGHTYVYGGDYDDAGFSGEHIGSMAIFANLNRGSNIDMDCYSGQIHMYDQDPGWGI